MQWSDSPYALLLLVAGSISGVVALGCLLRRKSLRATPWPCWGWLWHCGRLGTLWN